jgi:hypothetical protein
MTNKIIIGAVMVVIVMLLTGAVQKIEMGPPSYEEQVTIIKSFAEVKCDPCDYNIDYGHAYNLTEKGGVDEGVAKLECDPCDYNIDYGEAGKNNKK